MALSYCWGTKPVDGVLQLLQSTIEQLSREQPVESLKKTFRDAMNIAHRLGVSYIWIDRLCIFQDSAEDWQRESSSMQDVYKNAWLGISALGAEDDDGGCLFQRDPSKVAPSIVRFKLEEDGNERAFRFSLEKGWAWRLFLKDEPLVQRSWVVQERLLAPRTLHFGRKQLFWECCEASCCETHPHGVYDLRTDSSDEDEDEEMVVAEERQTTRNHPSLWKQLLDTPDRRHARDPYEQLFVDWNAVVTNYASLKLTVPGDKLIAISGLANDMKARLQQLKPGPHRYLAGLWEEKLMDTIAWNVRGRAKRALEYRAPSWSWASLDGRLSLIGRLGGRENFLDFASIVSAEMVHIGEQDTGEVKSGVLTLTGPYAVLQIGQKQDWEGWMRVDSIRSPDSGRNLNNEDGAPKEMTVIFDTSDDIRGEAVLLWVGAGLWAQGKWFGNGLVLSCVERDKYQRVGLAFGYFSNKVDAQAYVGRFPQKQVMIV